MLQLPRRVNRAAPLSGVGRGLAFHVQVRSFEQSERWCRQLCVFPPSPRPRSLPPKSAPNDRSDPSPALADVSESQAWEDELVWVNPRDDTVHLRVNPSKSPKNGQRDTVKLVSKDTHNDGE